MSTAPPARLSRRDQSFMKPTNGNGLQSHRGEFVVIKDTDPARILYGFSRRIYVQVLPSMGWKLIFLSSVLCHRNPVFVVF